MRLKSLVPALAFALFAASLASAQPAKKPNILVIWGDDFGLTNISAYSDGLMGSVYGVMDRVFLFAASFKDYPPRSVPPSFNPANIMEETLRGIKVQRKLEETFPMLRTTGAHTRGAAEEIGAR
jgi:hypothetical protein